MPPTRSDLQTLLTAIDALLDLTELLIDGAGGPDLEEAKRQLMSACVPIELYLATSTQE